MFQDGRYATKFPIIVISCYWIIFLQKKDLNEIKNDQQFSWIMHRSSSQFIRCAYIAYEHDVMHIQHDFN